MNVARNLTLALCACFAGVVSQSSSAAVFERDWKEPGDGLLTYDDVNQREWLDISESRLGLFSDIQRTDDAVAAAKEALLPGGPLDGFTLAKREDVAALVASAGVDLSTSQQENATAENMRDLMRLIDSARIGDLKQGNSETVMAVIDESMAPRTMPQTENASVAAVLAVTNSSVSRPNGRGKFGFVTSNDIYRVGSFAPRIGLAVFREVVPEPGGACLIVLGIGARILSSRARFR